VLASWVVFPLVMALLCLGCGLLLEAAAGSRLPRALVLPAGLALVVVLAQLAISTSVTRPLALPAVLAAAVAGLAVGRPWKRELGKPQWALGAAAGVFAVFAAPIVLSGQATFAGYIKLDDTATWLALTDHALSHGSSLSNLPVSTYGATLGSYLHTDYPLGSFLPLAIGHRLTGQDIAWLVQPYMAFMAAMLALCLYWLARRLLGSRALAALCAFGAAQAAALYGYTLWGGVKEAAAAWLVALTAALAADAAREARVGRALLPVTVAFAAGLSALSAGAVIWLAPSLIGALLLALRFQRRDVPVRQALVFVPLAGALAAPALASASAFFAGGGTLTKNTELGNLRQPLKGTQALGIWPAGDFRDATVHPTVTTLLLIVLGLCAIACIVIAWRRHAFDLPLFVIATAIGCLVVAHFGSPWVDGKAFATASPAFILAGLAGAAALLLRGRLPGKLAGSALAAAILGGVLWSNALAYRDVNLAPRAQLAELEQIGHRFAGQGPALMNDYDPYGARHFLRSLDTESVSELRVHVIPLRDGREVPKGSSADLDRFPPSSIEPYRTIVLHRSPVESRPPANYRLAWSGRYWQVWQRPVSGRPAIAADLPLGNGFQPGAMPECSSVLSLAAHVPPGGTLAAAPRTPPVAIDLTKVPQLPDGWLPDPAHAGALEPAKPGSLVTGLIVPRNARYALWLGGTFKSRVRVYLDGLLAASARGVLQWEPFVRIGSVSLTAGQVHQVRIEYDGPSFLHPGSGGIQTGLGPLVLSDERSSEPAIHVPPAQARSLCGRYLDWVEAVGPAG
jgi:hypothetical protein